MQASLCFASIVNLAVVVLLMPIFFSVWQPDGQAGLFAPVNSLVSRSYYLSLFVRLYVPYY